MRRTVLPVLVLLVIPAASFCSEFDLGLRWAGLKVEWNELDGSDVESRWDWCWQMFLDFWPASWFAVGLEFGWADFPVESERSEEHESVEVQQRAVWQEGALRLGVAPLNEVVRPAVFVKTRYAWADFDVGFGDRAFWVLAGELKMDLLVSPDIGLFAFGEYGMALSGEFAEEALGGGLMLRF